MPSELKPGALPNYLRLFRQLAGFHLVTYALVVLLSSWAEGLGIALLLPLLSQGVSRDDALSRLIAKFLDLIGLPQSLEGALVALVVVAFVKGGFTFLTISYQVWLTNKITQDLRRRLVNGLSRVDYKYILGTNTGTLTTLVYTQTIQTASAFQTLIAIFPKLVTITVFTAILAFLDWRLTLLVGLAGTVAGLLLRWPTRLAQRISARITAEGTSLTTLLFQTLYAFKYLAATNALAKLHRKIFLSVRSITVLGYKAGFLSALSSSLSQPLVALMLAGIMFYQLRFGTGISSGLVLLAYLYRMINEMFGLQVQWQAFAQITGPVDALLAGMRDVERRQAPNGTAEPGMLTQGIEFRKVSFAYEEKTVLREIDARIERNRTVAFVGESGSGKTTLMDLVTGLLRPTSGAVLVDGRPLEELDVHKWRERIGFVPQETVVFEDTVANNISLWTCDPSDPACMDRVVDAATRAYCDEFVRNMPHGYSSNIGDRGVKVSGGQRQRLAIARELFKRPEILILDEATSALDSESESFIQKSIEELKGKLTILVIAHRLSTIKRCDYLYVLEEGRIVEHGTYAELLARDGARFREMARLQNLD